MAQNRQSTEEAVRSILRHIGEDPDREGLARTPFRVVQAFEFLTQGYDQDPKVAINGALFTEEDYQEMILCRDLDFYSLCEHHRQGARRLPAQPAHRRLVEDRADGRDLCAQATGPGTTDDADCPYHNGRDQAAGRRRRARSRASVHAYARGREAELLRHDFGDARTLPYSPGNAPGVHEPPAQSQELVSSFRAATGVAQIRPEWGRGKPIQPCCDFIGVPDARRLTRLGPLSALPVAAATMTDGAT
jgi:GTP cyclohydrolase I-like protein